MSVSSVSSSIDPYAPQPVIGTGQQPARKGPREEPGARHGHHDHGTPPAETPSGEHDGPAGPNSVGTIVDVRV